MNKRIVIKIGPGSIDKGYAAAVQIGDEGTPPQVETQATLPPAPDLPQLYQRWREAYWQLGANYRIKAHDGVSNVSTVADIESCRSLSRQLRDRTHQWLIGDAFRPIHEKLLEQLSPQDHARILLQTEDPLLQRLPWYELEFFQNYRQAEVGVCAPDYQQVNYPGTRSDKVRILAVLGNATNLNTQIDQALLNNLEAADIHFLKEPSRETFNRSLWDAQGWDILFFAGHSSSQPSCSREGQEGSGEILLNATDKLTIPQLKHALKKAIDRGLNTAIFNSCDGLGLAADLADLHIPQVLVMREPVPDQIAHAFLQGFLESFSSGTPFYLAVREAREQLQGLEARFPCATWLPVIVQNLAEVPPTWQSLQGKAVSATDTVSSPAPRLSRKNRLKLGIGSAVVIATGLLAFRQMGALSGWELNAYDHFLRRRPAENIDSRLLIITNTEEDIQKHNAAKNNSSLSDETLSKLLTKLTPLNPQIIGLDIYRNQPATDSTLATQLQETNNLIAICKIPDETTGTVGRIPPPEIKNNERIGASDFIEDQDYGNILRRHLMYLSPMPGFPCQSGNTFSTVIALRYLKEVHDISFSNDNKYLGNVPVHSIEPDQTSFGGYYNLNTGGIQVLLNYRIANNPLGCGAVKETPTDCLTVSDILEKDAAELRTSIEGKIVLIGTTALSYGYEDRWTTPYTATSSVVDQVPGVFLEAQMISQVLSLAVGDSPRLWLTSWPDWQEMIWITSWALLGGIVSVFVGAVAGIRWRSQLSRLLLYLFLFEGLLLLSCWLWFTRAVVWVPWVPSAIALPAAALTTQAAFKVTTKRMPSNKTH